MSELTQEYLKECLHYCPDTGIFTWLERPADHFKRPQDVRMWKTRYAGTVAGSPCTKGYIQVKLKDKMRAVHRLAFLYVEGSMPEQCVDHINGVRDDNRWMNIRRASLEDNARNQRLRRNSTSGCTGVYWIKHSSKWTAQMRTGGKYGKLMSFGCFTDKADAIAARKAAEAQYGFHANHGRS